MEDLPEELTNMMVTVVESRCMHEGYQAIIFFNFHFGILYTNTLRYAPSMLH